MPVETVLNDLALGAIGRLKQLPQPVVRVSGPLTSGPRDYDSNLARFRFVEEKLKSEGFTVFDYFDGNNDEAVIKSLDVPWDMVMEHYHRPILETGLIGACYFIPEWELSSGASWEHDFYTTHQLEIIYVPEEWFPKSLR